MRTISHDPFSRESLIRVTEKTGVSCQWCGQVRKDGTLFHYYTERDAAFTGGFNYRKWNGISGLFCSVGCMRSYAS